MAAVSQSVVVEVELTSVVDSQELNTVVVV